MTITAEEHEARLEPGAVNVDQNIAEDALISMAMSLKRIADAFSRPVNQYGETMAEAIPAGIARALQEDRQWRAK